MMITIHQSNMTKGRIAAAHGQFDRKAQIKELARKKSGKAPILVFWLANTQFHSFDAVVTPTLRLSDID